MVSVGSPGHERQITNVAAGTDDTDAVNLAQLNAAIESIGGTAGGGGVDMDQVKAYADAGDATTLGSAKTYTDNAIKDANATLIKEANSYSDKGDATTLATAKSYADAGDAKTLKAADAYADKGDATVHAYVDQQAKSTLASAKDTAVSGDKATLASAEAYTDQRISQITGIDYQQFTASVNRRFVQQNNKINRTGALSAALVGMAASASAVTGAPTRMGVAVGHYHNKTALSLGIEHAFSSNVVLLVGAAFANSDHSETVGLGFSL